jgi:hypothetical protein
MLFENMLSSISQYKILKTVFKFMLCHNTFSNKKHPPKKALTNGVCCCGTCGWCICRYIESKNEHWQPAPMVIMRDVIDMNKVMLSVWLTHKMNYQDMGERWARRALLIEEMIKVFRELDIEYRMLPLDVNIRNMPPLISNRLPSNWATCVR